MNSTPMPGALFVADNVALDFINSEYGVGDQSHDCFTDDLSVAVWLKLAGLMPGRDDEKAPKGLVGKARELRESIRGMVHAAIEHRPADLTLINDVLEVGRPVSKLEWDGEAPGFRITSHSRDMNPDSLLWPVANAAVQLVTSDKFEYVRQCEAHDCILLFHDLSKSHRRRWCDMSTCGNRMKVAAFRSRKNPR